MTIRRLLRVFIPGCIVAITLWFGILVYLTYEFEPVPEVVIIGPEKSLLRAIQSTDVKIISGSAPYMTVKGTSPGFVRSLYRNGAWLILPGSVSGCIDPKNWVAVRS